MKNNMKKVAALMVALVMLVMGIVGTAAFAEKEAALRDKHDSKVVSDSVTSGDVVEEEPEEEVTEEEETEEETTEEETTEEEVTEEETTEEETTEEEISNTEIDLTKLKVEIESSLENVAMEGEIIVLTSKLTGFEGLTYTLQWQYNDGKGWKDVEGANGETYSFEADEENVSFQWRLAVSL